LIDLAAEPWVFADIGALSYIVGIRSAGHKLPGYRAMAVLPSAISENDRSL